MKKIILSTVFITVFALISMNMNAQKGTEEAIKNLEPYAETIDGLERHVIFLEPQADENLFKVEIVPGKMLEVDCNVYGLIGVLEEDIVRGWGYNYYVFHTEGHMASTLMACPEPKEMKFISGESQIVRYNSRLPIVVYLPKDYELRYRIWSVGEEQSAHTKRK